MTTASTTRTLTPSQRSAAAVGRVAQRLAIEEIRALSAALAEVAADEVEKNTGFAERVKRRYQEMKAKPSRASQSPKSSLPKRGGPQPRVAAGRTPGEHIDIVSPTDPRTLVPLYGQDLEAHLEEYSVRALWDMARVLTPHVGEKAPAQKSGRAALIAYILRYVR